MVNFKLATGGALSNYLAKYVAKPGVGLDAWPARTRWAQTIIAKVPRQVPRGTPEPRGWLVGRFPRFATERAARACFHLEIARREREVKHECGHASHGEVWSPFEDNAWAPRPPPLGTPPRVSTFSRIPKRESARQTRWRVAVSREG